MLRKILRKMQMLLQDVTQDAFGKMLNKISSIRNNVKHKNLRTALPIKKGNLPKVIRSSTEGSTESSTMKSFGFYEDLSSLAKVRLLSL